LYGDQFFQTNNCPAFLAPQAECTVSIFFKPTKTVSIESTPNGSQLNADIRIISNGYFQDTRAFIALTGNGLLVPTVAVSPTSLSFGNQRTGTTSSAQTITVSNTGNATLTISSVSLGGTDASQYAQTNNCSSVAAGSSCTISVTFTPTSSGSKSASVSIAHNASGSPTSVSLSATAAATPVVTVSPATLSFIGAVGTTSGAQVITVSNTGATALTVSGVSLTGADAALFSQTSNCASVTAGDSCTISVRFIPASSGSKSASISISHNGSGSPASVPITGTGRENALSADPLLLDFGTLNIGRKDWSQALRISSTASVQMSDLKFVFAGQNPDEFYLREPRSLVCPELLPNSNCTLPVIFSPRNLGSRSAIFRVENSAGAVLLTSSVVGRGAQGIVSINVSGSDFGSVNAGRSSEAKLITVSNTGDFDLTLKGVRLAGDHAGDFAILSNSCQTTIRVSAQCLINVTFRPRALGERRVRLLVETAENGGGVGAEFDFIGTGVTPVLDVSTTAIDFGVCGLGQSYCGDSPAWATPENRVGGVMLKNIGTGALTINRIVVVPSGFVILPKGPTSCNHSFPKLLKPNESCFFNVVFKPESRGSFSGEVYAETDEPKDIGSGSFSALIRPIRVSGYAIGADISFSPRSADNRYILGWAGFWPKVQAARTISITNSGEVDALLRGVKIVGSGTGNSAPHKFSVIGARCSDNRPFIDSLRSGVKCELDVLYVPTQGKNSGTDGARLEILYHSNGVDGAHYFELIGGATTDSGLNTPEGVKVAVSVDGDSAFSVSDSRKFSFTPHDKVIDRAERSSQSLVFRDGLQLSADLDSAVGTVFRMTRHPRGHSFAEMQGWQIHYGHIDGSQYRSMNLPDTAEMSWRHFGRIEKQLATTGWVRVCSDRVWVVQDGYQLLFHFGDRALTGLRQGQVSVLPTAEASVVTDVRCSGGGGVFVEGYAFGISDNEPPLRRSAVPGTRFGFALDRNGAVTKREMSSAPFDIVGLCAAPANEHQMFCSQAKQAVGW
jgi:hypothetical protein